MVNLMLYEVYLKLKSQNGTGAWPVPALSSLAMHGLGQEASPASGEVSGALVLQKSTLISGSPPV